MNTTLLESLYLTDVNAGGCYDAHHWLGSSSHPLEIDNPTTATSIAQVTPCTLSDYQQIIHHAHESALTWRKVPAPQRGELVRHIGEALRQHKEALACLISLEMGKPKQEALGEVQEMIDMADLAVGQSRMLYGYTMHSERPAHRLYEQWHPLGVVGVITAFNFPVAVWAWNAFIAAIAGNTVIWKPSSKTPLCALAVQHICNSIMADLGYTAIFCCFVPESHTVAEAFVEDSRVALISFTGSTTTGQKLQAKVHARFGRCLLEMSGNNAIIVDQSANLTLATNAIMFSAIGTSGQRCTSVRRLILHTDIYVTIMDTLIQAYERVRMGDPLDPRHTMGPLIDQAAVNSFTAAVDQAKQTGGEILYGGNVISGPGYFVTPTLIRAQNHWAVVQQETFAPILYIMTFSDLTEAIELNNAVSQGLSSALFTNQLQAAEYFLSALGSDCGIANINVGTSGAEIGGAFGGEKETGGGREAGSDAWKAYMRRQTTTINWGNTLPLAQGIEFELQNNLAQKQIKNPNWR